MNLPMRQSYSFFTQLLLLTALFASVQSGYAAPQSQQDAASSLSALAQTILNQSARMLAYAVYNMALVLNCPLFVLGGGVGMHPALFEATETILGEMERARALATDAERAWSRCPIDGCPTSGA